MHNTCVWSKENKVVADIILVAIWNSHDCIKLVNRMTFSRQNALNNVVNYSAHCRINYKFYLENTKKLTCATS